MVVRGDADSVVLYGNWQMDVPQSGETTPLYLEFFLICQPAGQKLQLMLVYTWLGPHQDSIDTFGSTV